jgi:uncharacterized membrane protein (DUF4010 family)
MLGYLAHETSPQSNTVRIVVALLACGLTLLAVWRYATAASDAKTSQVRLLIAILIVFSVGSSWYAWKEQQHINNAEQEDTEINPGLRPPPQPEIPHE